VKPALPLAKPGIIATKIVPVASGKGVLPWIGMEYFGMEYYGHSDFPVLESG
jgi:hypothetical protein